MTGPAAPASGVSESSTVPRNPAIGFVWAAAWLAVAVLGGVVLFTDWANIVSGNVSGQRTQGLLLFTPALGLVFAVLIAIRAVKALRPWNAYLAGTTGQERRERSAAQLRGEVWIGPLVMGIILGVIWLAGVVAVTIFLPHLAGNTAGLFVALMLLALLAMAWIPLLWMALRRRAVNLSR